MNHPLYVLFYTPPTLNGLLRFAGYYYFPPFVHVELAWDPRPLINRGADRSIDPKRAKTIPRSDLRFIAITGKTKHVVTGFRGFATQGYSWARITISEEQLVALNNTALYFGNREDTYFQGSGLWRCGTICPVKPPIIEQSGWFCSQLVTFLLQRIGIINPRLNASAVHPTELFLILCGLPSGCEAIRRPVPFPGGGKPTDQRTPAEIYLDINGIASTGGTGMRAIPREEIKKVRVFREERFNEAIRREMQRNKGDEEDNRV